MEGTYKSYGYEGGYEDWTVDKIVMNMRIMPDDKQVADVEESEDVGTSRGEESYTREDTNREEW